MEQQGTCVWRTLIMATFGEREDTCRANKHDTKKYIPNDYEKIYITSGACGSNEATFRVNRRVRRTPV